jgi:uncharacterized protein (DUF1778 family)
MSSSEKKPINREAYPFYGYAPGDYMGRCNTCETEMWNVDKHAYHCIDCAVIQAKKTIDNLNQVIASNVRRDTVHTTYLTGEEYDTLQEALANPTKPTQKLIDLFRKKTFTSI